MEQQFVSNGCLFIKVYDIFKSWLRVKVECLLGFDYYLVFDFFFW